MKNRLTFKTKFLATFVAVFILMINGGLALIGATKNALKEVAFAVYEPVEVTFSNGDFSTPSSGTFPLNPSNWTLQNSSDDIVSGIVDVGVSFEEKQESSYKLNFKPDTTVLNDQQILMINSQDTNSSCGYKSSSFSLSTSSYYVVSFRAYTENTQTSNGKQGHSAFATAFLSGDTTDISSGNYLYINTSGNTSSNWQNYYIFVETDDINSKSINLELWLGEKDGRASNGAVFFDDVNIYSYSHNDYNTLKANRNVEQSTVITFGSKASADFISNPSFENGLEGWTLSDDSSSTSTNNTITDAFFVDANYNSDFTKIEANPTNANLYQNKKALLINNLVAGHVGYESETFTIKQHQLYKLSFLAKTNDIDGSATVNLVERNPYTNEYLSNGTKNPNYYPNSTYEAKTFTISDINTSDYSNSKTENWKMYSFYIQGNPYFDSEVNLELWLGTEETNATGYVFFDNFTLEQISTKDYNSGSSNGTVANLNNLTATDFANGTFNNVDLEVSSTAPYTPKDWKLSQSNTSSFNGIVNTAQTGNNIPSINPISSAYPNNNVLMIGNTADNRQSYTSSAVSLSANSYYKIEVSALTYDLNKAKAGIRLLVDSVAVGEILNIESNNAWTTYTFLVKTGYDSKSVSVELSLGKTAQGTGYAFFDNIVMTSDLTEDNYNENLVDSVKINLANYDFTNIPAQNTNGLYAPYDFTASNKGSSSDNTVTSGVIDTAKFGTADGFDGANFENPSHPTAENSNVLMIHSFDDVYYSYTSKLKSKLSSSTDAKYYQVDVKVKTIGLSQQDENKVLVDGSKTKYQPYGASIKINEINAVFSGIDTNGEWETYTIYINCTTDTDITIELSLGNENALTSGAVFFSSANIKTITQSEYVEGISVLEDEDHNNILAIGNTDVETDTENNSSSTGSSMNFDWLIVPSLITALAILYAVVMLLIRNINKNKKKKHVVLKSYSKENIKRINNNHKKDIAEINKQKFELNNKQNQLAIEINKLKANGADEKVIFAKQSAYDENKLAIEKLEQQKDELNKLHKEKLNALDEEKKADEKLRK